MGSGISLKIPSGVAFIGGMTFKPYIPEFKNLEYSYDPFGYFRIALKIGDDQRAGILFVALALASFIIGSLAWRKRRES